MIKDKIPLLLIGKVINKLKDIKYLDLIWGYNIVWIKEVNEWKVVFLTNKRLFKLKVIVTNFIQLVSPQPVDRFSQTKLRWKAPNEGYLHICRMYKSDNK